MRKGQEDRQMNRWADWLMVAFAVACYLAACQWGAS